MGTTRQSAPRFTIGDGYAVYRGPTSVGTLHRHAAFQVAIGTGDDVSVVDASGVEHRALTLIVPPMVRHCLLADPDILIYFVEPHSMFAEQLRERCRGAITAAADLCGLTEADIAARGRGYSGTLDPRLARVLIALDEGNGPLASLAAEAGLSPQHLRTLARRELGMPLARWRIWTRLRRAAESVQDGQSLADAAATAGFADQAHLTRQMREMMGLTPASVSQLLRGHSLHPT